MIGNRPQMRRWGVVMLACIVFSPAVLVLADPESAPERLDRYVNMVPPSDNFMCVGNGPEYTMMHPDRSPYTNMARQGNVLLMAGAPPQQGLNFTLNAGSLIYRNEMSTWGSTEPLTPNPLSNSAYNQTYARNHFQLWMDTSWSSADHIAWTGEFGSFTRPLQEITLHGLEYYDEDGEVLCEDLNPVEEAPVAEDVDPWSSSIGFEIYFFRTGNLQLGARGAYQMAMETYRHEVGISEHACPFRFREPWFQGRGRKPAFNIRLDTNRDGEVELLDAGQSQSGGTVHCSREDALDGICDYRLAAEVFPNFFCHYPYRQLEMNGGSMTVDFERSAMNHGHDNQSYIYSDNGEGIAGKMVASQITDAFGNRVSFEHSPSYGWETDYKISSHYTTEVQTQVMNMPAFYEAIEHQQQLPHKRLRSVKLYTAEEAAKMDNGDPATATWTVVFVHEHPDSDRISLSDTTLDNKLIKSIYSFLDFCYEGTEAFDSVPNRDDQTALLTVQVYPGDEDVNGGRFQDDYFVWRYIGYDPNQYKTFVNLRSESVGDGNGDGCPGICGIDDDGDGLVDEDCEERLLGEPFYGDGCNGNPVDDDNEDGISDWVCAENDPWAPGCTPGEVQGVTDPAYTGNPSSDPKGDANDDHCPGICGVDDDGDGLIDEDTNGYVPYLDFDGDDCDNCRNWLINGEWDFPPDGCLSDPPGVLNQTHIETNCRNPLYWPDEATGWLDGKPRGYDFFADYDDDEDGLIDEDTADNPLLVHLRAFPDPENDPSECSSGVHPFVPASTPDNSGDLNRAQLPGSAVDVDCRPIYTDASEDDPWLHQVQYVYARNNPYWLLGARDDETGSPVHLTRPQYYYFAPFSRDLNRDGDTDDEIAGGFYESQIYSDFGDLVVDSAYDDDGLPNVHPDCVPHPDYTYDNIPGQSFANDADIAKPSGIHLIKRIVRSRPDYPNNPGNIIEQTWLYRYNDFGFLKAVFDPTAVQALIDANPDDAITAPDDILKYSDTYTIEEVIGEGGTGPIIRQPGPLIFYASQWYTYYNETHIDMGAYPDLIDYCYDSSQYLGSSFFYDDPDEGNELPVQQRV